MPAIEGSCLCGAVRLSVARAPISVTQCNCSTCRRYGTLWAYYQRCFVSIAPRAALASYSVRRGGLRFVRCKTCGCVVAWEGARGPNGRMGVNSRLLDHAALARVPISVLDGDATWRVLAKAPHPEVWISPSRATVRAKR